MKVAICDDDIRCRARALDIAEDYREERKDAEIEFECFSGPEELLSALKSGRRFSIYILDIVMPGMNGIQLGQEIRRIDTDGKIIYLTSSEEYALESFRIRAFDYLMKPIDKNTFYTVMDEAVSSIHIKKDKVLVVKTKEYNARITYDSILYAELAKRAVVYHMTDGKKVEGTTLRTTFSEAMKELVSDNRFVLCGASMAVNLHHITMVETEGIVFTDGRRVFLGKKACRELRAAWSNYWISEGGK